MESYKTLAKTVGIHFIIMLALTYVGVNALEDVYLNLNRFYMAVVMVAPMIVLMLWFMGDMFPNKKLNYAIYVASGALFVLGLYGIRSQLFVGDTQFLKSMIPHHSIAIKTCERANIEDQQIKDLCDQIIESQRDEISEMNEILNRMENKE